MKKLLAGLLAALMLAVPALAEEMDVLALLPAGAEAVDGGWALPSGEVVLLNVDESGEAVSLVTQTPVAVEAAGEQSREGAEQAVRAEYPGALVLASEALEDGSRVLSVLTPSWSGAVTAAGDGIVSRELSFGAFIDGNRLTMDGARAALSLLRPGAEIAELELDEDDGMLLYEGEAFVDGVEYEFEMNAKTGKLLEWERD